MKPFALGIAATALALLSSCRGQPSDQPPVNVVPDMDMQPKFKAQSSNPFFADGRAMRPLVPGVVAVGHLDEDDGMFQGKVDGVWLERPPMTVDEKLLARGEERYNIFCAPCHDKTGSSNGTVIKRGFKPPPPALYEDHGKAMKDGELYAIIANGRGNMPSYRPQIPVADRWAIVTWVRVLQRSQKAKSEDVPAGTQVENATP